MSVLLVFTISSCSTTKNKWYNRAYHRTVAHYNAYWNGNDAFKEGRRTIVNSEKDDFNQILPIYKVGSEEDVAKVKPNMERAIDKSSKVIKKHSMFIDGKERNPEIKKAYLLIGKSSFYKKDYKTAEATFKYIINAYKEDKIAYEAMIWLGFTYSKDKQYSLAESTLDQVRSSINAGKAPKRLRQFLYSVYAENAIAQNKNAKALEFIQLSRKESYSRGYNTRLMFIEAQFYYRADELERAKKLFGKTARRAKELDMEFASKLFQAMCYDPRKGDSKKVLSKLERMLREKKNETLKDQIYYTMGEIYFKDKNVDKACDYWKKSVSSSIDNDNQKVTSSIRLGDISYELLEEYETSYIYYDTALFIMKKDHNDFPRINSRQIVLENLVKNLRIVNRWDSLIALSELSEAELNRKIDGWIAEYKAEQEELRKEELRRQAILQRASANNPYAYRQDQSSWYFYNNNTVQAGKTEFLRVWGNRKLEDNWRLSQKQGDFSFDDDMDFDDYDDMDSLDVDGNVIAQEAQKILDRASREYYTQDIPRTDGAKDTAHVDISNALLSAGYIYHQGIHNNPKAIATFLELHKRYPHYPTTLPSSYHLYRLYDQEGQTPNSNYYKALILNDYPDSEYAYMITNPDYWKEESLKDKEAQDEYEKVYDLYRVANYEKVISQSESFIKDSESREFIPRFLYIKALSKGKIYGIDSLINELNMIIYQHPEHEIASVIENQLKYLTANYDIASDNLSYVPGTDEEGSDLPSTDHRDIVDHTLEEDEILDAESLIYRYRDMEHFYVILFDDDNVNVSSVRTAFSDFNREYFGAEGLKLTSLLFTMNEQMITIDRFPSIDKAIEYYNTLINSKKIIADIDERYYHHFIISTQNYPTFYNRKNIPAYMKFFRVFYLNNNEKNNK